MDKFVTLLAILLLSSCVTDVGIEPACNSRCGRLSNVDVRDLKKLLHTSFIAMHIDDDLILEGVVIANDYDGNFYRSVMIEGNTGGFELLVGLYDLHLQFPIGRTVHILLDGLTIDKSDEVLRVGLSKNEIDIEPPGYFSYQYILNQYVCYCLEMIDEVRPEPVILTDLNADMCGQLVTLSGIRSVAPGLLWADDEREYSLFVDEFSEKIAVEVSKYANFASEVIPNGEVEITGVLTFQDVNAESVYVLKIRNLDDITIK